MTQQNSIPSVERLWLRVIHAKRMSLLGALRAVILWPMSLVYRLGVATSKLLAPRPLTIRTPLITVGGMTVGGSGKTPFVALLVRELIDNGKEVGVVCSGYGRANDQQLVGKGEELLLRPVEDTGDEPRELAEMFPEVYFAVNKSKRAALEALAAEECVDVIVVDDGFQTRGIRPDLAIVLINSQSTLADFRLMPTGRLREPLTALKRADIVVFSKLDAPEAEPADWIRDKVRDVFQGATINSVAVTKLTQVFPAPLPSDASVDYSSELPTPALLVSGLADNSGFQNSARGLGIQYAGAIEFSDHFQYDAVSVAEIVAQATEVNAKAIVTSAKDWVKLREFSLSVPVWIITLRAEICEKQRFSSLVENSLQRDKANHSRDYSDQNE
jgi:tetraacyldisaccharide 4'-kinase